MSLASHVNAYNTCLQILRSRGYALEVSGELEADGTYPAACHWIARRDGFYFCGDNPIELLGLAAVYDFVQPPVDRPYWWKIEGPDIQEELYEAAFPEEAQQSDSAPPECERG
ncbi:MAG TPA: hypothetical protein VGE52_18380 [Pirellulales bacterium]